MSIGEFLHTCHGEVSIHLSDGSSCTAHFRTDILSPDAVSAYFYGNNRDLSLPIAIVDRIDHLQQIQVAC
jgi:hypothetical protein